MPSVYSIQPKASEHARPHYNNNHKQPRWQLPMESDVTLTAVLSCKNHKLILQRRNGTSGDEGQQSQTGSFEDTVDDGPDADEDLLQWSDAFGL